MRLGGCVQLRTLLILHAVLVVLVLCTSPRRAQARIRMNDGVDDYFVEYEDHELPENETFSDEEAEEAWGLGEMLDLYGFDIEPCLATGCTEEMLTNDQCDELCNHAACDYDITLCFKFFDMHGCMLTFLPSAHPVCFGVPTNRTSCARRWMGL